MGVKKLLNANRRVLQLQLSEKQHQDIATQGNMHERGDEASEIQEFLSQRLMKRGASFAAAEAEQLLTQRAKTRREWEEVYEKTQEVLQQQLRDHTEPLFQQTSQDFKVYLLLLLVFRSSTSPDARPETLPYRRQALCQTHASVVLWLLLQQLGEALEVASSQTERAAEAKRLRLSKESWESSFMCVVCVVSIFFGNRITVSMVSARHGAGISFALSAMDTYFSPRTVAAQLFRFCLESVHAHSTCSSHDSASLLLQSYSVAELFTRLLVWQLCSVLTILIITRCNFNSPSACLSVRSAMAEERHFALQSAAKNVDGTAASLGHFLEQETQVS